MIRRIVPDIVQDQTLHTLRAEDRVLDAARRMKEWDTGAAIIVDAKGHLEGILSERDIARRVVACGLDPATTLIAEVMSRNPCTVAPSDTGYEALEIMRERHYRHLPVVDGGRVIGMLSVRDLYEIMKGDLEHNIRETEAFVFGDRYGA